VSAAVWFRSGTQVINASGRKASGAKVYFFNPGTTTPLTVFSDSALATPRTHPVECDANGIVPDIFLPYGAYRVRVETSTGTVITDTDNIANPAPPDSGGGSGIVVSEDEIHQTGDLIIGFKPGVRAGAVRLNGGTIGNAVSGATERANADTADLFAFNWNNFDDTICPVSGGRGANALADYTANKTLTLPSGRGKTIFGSDTMGAAAANISQRSTTITTTNLNTSATVADVTGLYVGMRIVSADVPAGTEIQVISGSTITMSSQATATASGKLARFSTFTDAEKPGTSGGLQRHTLAQNELPTTLGEAVTTISNGTTMLRGGAAVSPGAGLTAATVISDITASTVISNNSGGKPHNNMPPGLVVYFWQKL
jgi:hypothetical protein